jgi:ribosomal protein L29
MSPNITPKINTESSEHAYQGDITKRCAALIQLAKSNKATEDELIELRMTQSVLDAEKTGRARTLKPDLIAKLALLKEKNEQN